MTAATLRVKAVVIALDGPGGATIKGRPTMSMTKDASHQSLDINLGRVVELFIEGDIPIETARENICKHFHGKHVAENRAALETYVNNVLDMVRSGELEPVQARNGLVTAAAKAEKGDPAFASLIKTQAGPSKVYKK